MAAIVEGQAQLPALAMGGLIARALHIVREDAPHALPSMAIPQGAADALPTVQPLAHPVV